MKKLSIVIVNYNGWKDTRECLESLEEVSSSSVAFDVIVVDNNSKKSIKYQVSSIKQKTKFAVTLIENKENLGFARGNNKGIAYALGHDADYVMLLNNDTTVDRNFIDPLITFSAEHQTAGIIGPKIYFSKGFEFHRQRYSEGEKGHVIWYAGGMIDWDNVYASHRGVDEVDIGRYNRPEQTQFVSGCCIVIKREVFSRIGLLDDTYFMYLEDVDFCKRAEKAGFELWYVPSSHIWHKNARSSGESGSDLHVYYQTRNRLLFAMKYASFRTKLALLKNSIHVIRSNQKRRKAVIDFYLMRFGRKEEFQRSEV